MGYGNRRAPDDPLTAAGERSGAPESVQETTIYNNSNTSNCPSTITTLVVVCSIRTSIAIDKCRLNASI